MRSPFAFLWLDIPQKKSKFLISKKRDGRKYSHFFKISFPPKPIRYLRNFNLGLTFINNMIIIDYSHNHGH